MSVKPTLLRDIKKSAAQQHQARVGIGTYNRFTPLTPRGRILSVGKRQLDLQGEDDGIATKTPKLDSNTIFTQLKDQDTILDEADSIIAELEKSNVETPDLRLTSIVKVLKLLGKSQRNLTSVVNDNYKLHVAAAPQPPVTIGTSSQVGHKKPASAPAPPPLSEEEQKVKKVKSVLRDAEKKTVLFNLDLGKNPAMNKDTLSRKVTDALGTAVRSGKHDYHIGDAEEVLDDILSCSKLEFLGTQSKLFFNNRNEEDARNNNMYTLPVRMDFKDRETRFEAEIMLRKLCKVNCSVPYPKKMRKLITDIVSEGKALQPDCYIRTKVNVENLTIEAHAKTGSGWLDLGIKKQISLDILDNTVSHMTASQMAVDEQIQIS
jgi:hypothetical protein